jgi:hypothetical protein
MIHENAMIGQSHGFLLVMRDMDEGGADALLDRLQLVLHLAAELQVEGPEGLVQEENGGLDDERPGQGDALALAA